MNFNIFNNINSAVILLSVICSLFSCNISVAQTNNWTWQNPRPQGNVLYDIQFIDSLNGWACGDFGTLMKTEDSGKNWKLYHLPSKDLLYKIYFINKNSGFISSYSRQTFVTKDGGTSWDTVSSLSNRLVCQFQFLNEKLGFLRAIDSTWGYTYIHKTTDGGKTWCILDSHPVYWGSSAFFFLDEDFGWINTSAGLYRTTDGGKTWYRSIVPGLNTGIVQIQFIDKSHGFLIGNSLDPISSNHYGIFASSTDGGITWVSKELPDKHAPLYNLHFTSDLTGYITTSDHPNGRIFYTTNAGSQWKTLGCTVNNFSFATSQQAWGIDGYNIIRSTSEGWMTSYEQTPSITSAILNSVCALDSNNIAAAGQFSTIVISSNGGRTWEKIYSSQIENNSIQSVLYKNENEIWAVRGTSPLLWSMDKGKSWSFTQLDTLTWLNDITFPDDTTGFIIGTKGSKGILYRGKISTDKISFTWEKVQQFDFKIEKIKFSKRGTGYIAGDRKVLKSTDRGKTWLNIQMPLESNFITLEAFDDFVCTVGGNKILISTDAGNTWNTYKAFDFPGPYSAFSYVRAMSFADRLNGLMGLDGRIIRTTDGGITWKECQQLTSDIFYDIAFINNAYAWAVGPYGLILNYNSHLTDISKISHISPDSWYLYQNYPNPFNPVTTIRYIISKESHVELKVYDVLGREVSTLVNKGQSAGEYKVQFDGSTLPSGMYIFSIQAGYFRDSKKLLLLK